MFTLGQYHLLIRLDTVSDQQQLGTVLKRRKYWH